MMACSNLYNSHNKNTPTKLLAMNEDLKFFNYSGRSIRLVIYSREAGKGKHGLAASRVSVPAAAHEALHDYGSKSHILAPACCSHAFHDFDGSRASAKRCLASINTESRINVHVCVRVSRRINNLCDVSSKHRTVRLLMFAPIYGLKL